MELGVVKEKGGQEKRRMGGLPFLVRKPSEVRCSLPFTISKALLNNQLIFEKLVDTYQNDQLLLLNLQ